MIYLNGLVCFNISILFGILLSHVAHGVEFEKRLQEDLINNYNRLVRPVEKNSDKLVVKLGIKLIQILDVVKISFKTIATIATLFMKALKL